MKRILSGILVLVVFCCSAFASEIDVVLDTVMDGILSVIAASASNPAVQLQGVEIDTGSGVLPGYVSYTRSDLASYHDALSFSQTDSLSWYTTFIGSPASNTTLFKEKALQSLERADYEKGEVILDGSVRIRDAESIRLKDLVKGSDWTGAYIPVTISLLVSGTGLSGMHVVEGKIDMTGLANSTLLVEIDEMILDGEGIEVEPFHISY